MSWKRVVIIALCLVTIAFVAYFAKDALTAVIAFITGLVTGYVGTPNPKPLSTPAISETHTEENNDETLSDTDPD